MRQEPFDVTAGETARRIGRDPSAPEQIRDVTDPRFRELAPTPSEQAKRPSAIVDPTDPRSGGLAA
jgi:hypothetical protein